MSYVPLNGRDPRGEDINECTWMFRKISDMDKEELKEVIHKLFVMQYEERKQHNHERQMLTSFRKRKPSIFGSFFDSLFGGQK